MRVAFQIRRGIEAPYRKVQSPRISAGSVRHPLAFVGDRSTWNAKEESQPILVCSVDLTFHKNICSKTRRILCPVLVKSVRYAGKGCLIPSRPGPSLKYCAMLVSVKPFTLLWKACRQPNFVLAVAIS